MKGKDRNKLECVAWIAAALSGADGTWGQGTRGGAAYPGRNTLNQTWTQSLYVAICLISLFALETPEEGKKPHSEQEEEGQAEGRG